MLDFDVLLQKASEIIEGQGERDEKLLTICKLLSEKVSHYDWVGFYLVDPEKERELILGPYVGDPTEHVNIRFGEGICGQSAETEETIVVQDVSTESNYLACSLKVRSEIVVPILKNGEFVGQLDIDSHITAPFTKHDEDFLQSICDKLSTIF